MAISHTGQIKLFKGAYVNRKGNSLYSEESFEVYKDPKEFTYAFHSEIHSRVLTGELLKIEVDYLMNKDMIPLKVNIQKDLGSKLIKETYINDRKKSSLLYKFDNGTDITEHTINTPPIFHIGTPAACSSTLFIQSKKFEQTGDNFYTIFSTNNQWTCEEAPKPKVLILKRPSLQAESIVLNGNALDAVHYQVYDGSSGKLEEVASKDIGHIYLSRYLSIPYMVKEGDLKIEIKFLNVQEDY